MLAGSRIGNGTRSSTSWTSEDRRLGQQALYLGQACTRFIDVGALGQTSPQTSAEEAGTLAVAPADQELVDLFGAAWKASKRDDRGFARLSEVGERAGNRSSFDTRNYCVTRLSDLIATLPNFVTEKRDDGGMWVKRVR